MAHRLDNFQFDNKPIGKAQYFLRGAIFIAVPVIYAIPLYLSTLMNLRLVASGVTAPATLIGIDEIGTGRAKSTFPVFEFVLPDGGRVETRSQTSMRINYYSKGMQIEVLYLPADPEIAVPRKNFLFWLYICSLLFPAALLSLLALAFHSFRKALATSPKL